MIHDNLMIGKVAFDKETGENYVLMPWEIEELRDPDPEAVAILHEQHRGFEIRCEVCHSNAVGVTSDVGFSPTSGCWGGVQLRCAKCGQETEIWQV